MILVLPENENHNYVSDGFMLNVVHETRYIDLDDILAGKDNGVSCEIEMTRYMSERYTMYRVITEGGDFLAFFKTYYIDYITDQEVQSYDYVYHNRALYILDIDGDLMGTVMALHLPASANVFYINESGQVLPYRGSTHPIESD